MKRILFYTTLTGMVLFLFGCDMILDALVNSRSDDTDYTPSTTVTYSTATESISAYYSGSTITVDPKTRYLTVTGNLGGKTIYLAKTNPSATLIPQEYSRFVTNATSNITKYTGNILTRAATETDSDVLMQDNRCATMRLQERFADDIFSISDSARATTTYRQIINRTNSQISRTIGTTKKIWVDYNNFSGWIKTDTTLRAIGTYCNVWVADDCWSDSGISSNKKINTTIAKKMATFFDDVYLLETKLYGKESDQIFYPPTDSSQKKFVVANMETLSDTGTIVNLVVYDITSDGTLGFFANKDYYPNLDDLRAITGQSYTESSYNPYASNEGKYLYIDSVACREEVANVMTIITHEYQHLITWGRKTMNHYNSSIGTLTAGSAFNEMLAMEGEDFMKDYTMDKYASDGFAINYTPIAWRLPSFNKYYYYSGLEYRSGNSEIISYSTNFAFGTWLARNYGGAKLMNYLVNSVDTDYYIAIPNGVSATTGTTVTMETLLKDFVYDCVISKDGAGFRKTIGLSPSDELYCTEKSYGYPLASVNLHNLRASGVSEEKLKNGSNSPYFFPYNSVASNGVRPYGIELNKIGTIADGATSINLEFNSQTADALRTYLIIE